MWKKREAKKKKKKEKKKVTLVACDHPTNTANVNLMMGCSKVFSHYCNTCPRVLTLCK